MQHLKFALGAVVFSMSLPSFAAPVIFLLGDHSDGALYDGATNPYGIRVDDAPPPGVGPTFSVGTNLPGGLGGPVTLTWDPMDLSVDAVITGVVERNDDGTFWDVTYTMTGLAAAGSGGFTASAGTGSLDEQGGLLRSIALSGESNGSEVFEFDDDGHRLPGDPGVGWVGRGWLLPTGSTDDWLVTGVVIPLPAAVWLFGGSLLALLGLRRRSAVAL